MIKDLKALTTDYDFNAEKPLDEYPRPQLRRDSFYNLNGKWFYKIFDNNDIFTGYNDLIIVPYPLESALSGVGRSLEPDWKIGYRKEIFFPQGFLSDKTFLRFEAVSQVCDVYFNRNFVAHHEDSYTSFSADVTDLIKEGRNEIVVIVKKGDSRYQYGKQRRKSNASGNTTATGIRQTVWMESVNYEHITDLTLIPDIDRGEIRIKIKAETITEETEKEIRIYYHRKQINKIKTVANEIVIPLKELHLWTPESPALYDLEIRMRGDIVFSYFGMRKFGIGDINHHKMLCLNNRPYYFHGLLDRGYYPDGLYTPKNYDICRFEISKAKELGFNTLRKYMKTEPLIWYHLCDKAGMIVWQDFVSTDCNSNMGRGKKNAWKLSEAIADKLKNVVSVVLWFDPVGVCGKEKIKKIDDTRYIVGSGRRFYGKNDNPFNCVRKYNGRIDFTKIPLRKAIGSYQKPLIIAEFGGYTLRIADHIGRGGHDGFYRRFSGIESYNREFRELYERDIIKNLDVKISGSVYRQLTDTDEEHNGILTVDRKVCKLNEETAKAIAEKLTSGNYGEQE